MSTGATLFVESLKHLEISEIFTLVGDHLNDVLAEAAAAGLRIVDMRHESGVTHAADAWARLHRKPAVALVTGGPGHTNSITGIATANLAGSPVIAVSGSRATTMADRQGFQDIDQVSMTRPIVKWAAEPPNATQIPFYLRRAWSEANSGRRGAVHLTIPVDLFSAEAGPATHASTSTAAAVRPAEADAAAIAAALRRAERPVIIAGSGIWWADAGEELRSFVERTSIPLYTLAMARGVVRDDHPLCMGIGHPAVNEAVRKVFREADTVLVLGKRIDFRLAFGGARLFSPDARFLQVDIHPQELGMNRKLDIGICADVKETLRALLIEARDKPWPESKWVARVRAARQEFQNKLSAAAENRAAPLHPAAVYAEMQQAFPPGVLYAWDGGDFTHWGRSMTPALHAGGWLRLGPLATIGAALPYGLALQLANPDKPVAVITGDGALGFYIAEMDTAVRLGLPIVIIVGNDAGWGLEREFQAVENPGRSVACELRRTRYDIVMQGFGGGGENVDTIDQLRPAVERAFSSGVPYCINVNIRGTRSPFAEWQIQGKQPRA
jgi:acetolactate synthase I/II/III large subunit